MSTPLRVLIVEDSEDDAELLLRELRRGDYEPTFARVQTAAAMRAALAEQPWDIIIADYSLPQFSAPDALALLQQTGLEIPLVVLSGTIGEEVAVSMVKAGAHDYLMKGNLARLLPTVEREVREAQERQARRLAEQERDRLAQIIEATTDMVGIADLEGRGAYINISGRKLLGIGPEEAISGVSLAETHAEWARRIVLDQGIPTAIRDGTWHGETAFVHRDGHEIPISQVIIAHKASDGSVQFLSTIARDITARKQAEEQILQQMQHLNALRTIDMAITASLDVRVTLNVVLDQVTSQLGVDAADILLVNPHTQMLEYAAGRGFHSNAISRTRLRLGECLAGRAALERRVVAEPQLSTSGFTRGALLEGEGFSAYFGAPLIAKGFVKGVLETFHRSPLDHDPEWLEFLDALAAQTAIAIDNAGLFDDLQRSNTDLRLAYDATLEGWVRALDLRDKETEGHSVRVVETTESLARALGVPDSEIIHMRRGALLHDVGKMGVPDVVLLKPGPLTEEEWELMRRHPQYAHDWLSPIAYLRPALAIPLSHHEKWDGTGYPHGLKGEQIPMAARIFAIIDVWDALLSDRPYRPAWTRDRAIEHLREQAGSHFEPRVVETFLQLMA